MFSYFCAVIYIPKNCCIAIFKDYWLVLCGIWIDSIVVTWSERWTGNEQVWSLVITHGGAKYGPIQAAHVHVPLSTFTKQC